MINREGADSVRLVWRPPPLLHSLALHHVLHGKKGGPRVPCPQASCTPRVERIMEATREKILLLCVPWPTKKLLHGQNLPEISPPSPLLLLLLLLHSAPPISLLREHPSPFPLSCAAFLSSSTILRLFISKSSNFSFSNRRSSRFSFFWEREREKINGFISKIGDQIFHLLSR